MEINKKNLLLYLFGQSISKVGSSILDFAIIWTVLYKFKSSIPFTMSILLTYIPKIFLGFLFNQFNLKFKQKGFIIFGDLFTAFFSLLFFIIDFKNLNIIYFLIFFRSIGSGIYEPYSNSIIVLLFNEKYYKYINSLNSFLKSIVSITVPTITSLVLTIVGLKYIVLIDFITAIINVISVYFLEVLKEIDIEKKNEKIKLNQLGYGILKINTLFYFFMTIPGFMTALLVKFFFGYNMLYLNLNETFWTIGMIIGSLLSIKNIKSEFKIFFSSMIYFGMTIILLSFSNNIYLYLLFIIVSGITFPFYTTSNSLVIQKNLNELEVKNYYIKESIYINIAIPTGIFIFGFLSNVIKINILFLFSGIIIIFIGFISKKYLKLIVCQS
jgi:MFS transporter